MLKTEEAEAYLEEISSLGSILGLDSIRALMGELGNVQEKMGFVHVAGTNGKGSVCAMVSEILAEAGIRVGTYTSPAVFGRMEQYRVNGAQITSQEFAAVVSEIREACNRMRADGKNQPTVFEVETAAAFLYFYQKNCQVVVLETGMGGETDATNVIGKPLVSVLTSISMDHMKFLGDNLADIARAKAGIIKEGCPVVAVRPVEGLVRQILEEVCRKKDASLTYADGNNADMIRFDSKKEGIHFLYEGFGEVSLSMSGMYQVENAVCAMETAKILADLGFPVTKDVIRAGLLKARWEGRFSVLCEEPLFVMDGAHNADAAKKLRETLKRGFTNQKIIYIIGVLADKEHEEMLKIMLPLAWKVFTVTPAHPRALDGQKLAREAGKYHKDVVDCPRLAEAVKQALEQSRQEGAMTLAFGSLSYLKELREIFKEITDYDR